MTPTQRPSIATLGLAAMSGVLYAISFPGLGVFPLTFVAFVPLLIALSSLRTPRLAHALLTGAQLGWVSGFAMCLIGFRFVLPVLTTHGGFSAPISFVLLGLLAASQALRIALLGALTMLGARAGLALPWAFVLATPLSESVPMLVEWSWAAAAHPLPALTQVADLGGAPLVSTVLASINASLFTIGIERGAERRIAVRKIAASFIPIMLALGYAWLRAPQLERALSSAPALPVGLVQGNMPLAPSDAEAMSNVIEQRALHRWLEDNGARLVVWSEAALPFVLDAADPGAGLLAQLGSPRVATIVGAVLQQRPASLFNSVLSVEQGVVTGRRDKQILMPFGEYLPFGEDLPWLHELSPASGYFSPGPSRGPLQVDGALVGASICYEDVLSAQVLEGAAESRARLLINVTNDGWFRGSDEPEVHLALARLRAIELRRFLIRATNDGASAIIDPGGRVLRRGVDETAMAMLGEVKLLDGRTLYSRFGWVSSWGWAAGALLFAMAQNRRALRSVRNSAP